MNNYWLIQSRIKNYSIFHKALVYMVYNLLCHNPSNRRLQYPPNSCFYRRESSKTSINLRMNLIFSHTSLTNNWFAPPHNWTRFEIGAARKSHKIVPCAVFLFAASVLPPHLSSKLSAVLIKYFTSHTVLRFSSRFYHNYRLKGKSPPPRIWSKTDVVDVRCSPIRDFR